MSTLCIGRQGAPSFGNSRAHSPHGTAPSPRGAPPSPRGRPPSMPRGRYHPHADGSTSLQSLGGMGGALVVTDAAQESNIALPAVGVRVLLVQALNFDASSPDYVLSQVGCQMYRCKRPYVRRKMMYDVR